MGPFWGLLALTYPFTVAAYSAVRGDIWWNLSTGRWTVENQALPTAYPFSFAPQAGQFYDTQWLAHLVYDAVYHVLGLEGVVAINALVITATLGLVLAMAWARSGNRFVAVGCTVGCGLLAASNLQPRAQTFGFLLFAATYWLLTQRRGIATLAAVGMTQVLWSNLHGSFFLGPTLTGVVLAGETLAAIRAGTWRDPAARLSIAWLGGALLVQMVATVITPYGLSGFSYAYGAMTDPTARRYGEEWLPPTLSTFTGAAFFVSVAIVGAVVAWSRRLAVSDALMLLVFAWFGFQAVRNVIWWAMAVTPILASLLLATPIGPRLHALEASARAQARRRQGVDRFMAAVLLGLMVSTLPWLKPYNPIVPAEERALVSVEEPLGAATFLAEHDLPSRMYAPQVWGAYLGWRLWPRYSVMVGPIIEIHPAAVWDDYLSIAAGREGWEMLLDRYQVDLMFLSVAEQPRLLDRARSSAQWREVYSDQQAAMFARAGVVDAQR